MPCYSPLKGWKDIDTGGIRFDRSNSTEQMEVACGQCLGCRLDRSRHWAMRIIHESSLHDGGNCFVTLTYRDKEECSQEDYDKGFYIPEDWSLHKDHFQKFMKRLRRALPDRKIRYYMCGEYGSVCSHRIDLNRFPHEECPTGRPHFHCCIFNFWPGDGEPIAENVRSSPFLDSVWKYGYTSYGDLTFQSAAYVSRYVLKKVNGLKQFDHYQRITDDGEIIYLEPEYSTMSRRPGIAKDWYEEYKSDCFPSDEVPIPGTGVVKSVPRYYMEQLRAVDEGLFDQVKAERQKFLQAHKEDFTPERLMAKYKVKKAELELFQKRNEL